MRATRSKEKDYGVSAASVDCMRSILQIVYDHGVVAMYRMEKGKKVRTQREFEKWFIVDSRDCGLPDDIVPHVGTLYEGVVTVSTHVALSFSPRPSRPLRSTSLTSSGC